VLLLDPALKSATPRLSHDELTIYFTSDNVGTGTDLLRAVRATKSDAFGTPATMTTQSSTSNDNDPAPSADHLSLFFHTGRAGNNDLWVTTRASTTADFGMPSAVPVVNDATAGDSHPYYRSGGGGELYFTSLRNASPQYRVHVAKKNVTGFMAPAVVPELVGAWNDWQPMVTEDGLTMLFASDRPTAGSGFHLYTTSRASEADPWGTPQPITELTSTEPGVMEFAGWLSADRCRIYFSSSRDSTLQRAYFASRPR
jgi:Tol biopolymer transport system component